MKAKDVLYTAIYTGLQPSRVRPYNWPYTVTFHTQSVFYWMSYKDIKIILIFIFQSLQMISETSVSNQPVGRSLLQAVVPDVKPPIMFNVSGSPCIMLWAQNLTISFTDTWIDLAAQTPSLTGSICNSNTSLWEGFSLFSRKCPAHCRFCCCCLCHLKEGSHLKCFFFSI